MIDPAQLEKAYSAVGDTVAAFREMLYEIWHEHPGDYHPDIVKVAERIWCEFAFCDAYKFMVSTIAASIESKKAKTGNKIEINVFGVPKERTGE